MKRDTSTNGQGPPPWGRKIAGCRVPSFVLVIRSSYNPPPGRAPRGWRQPKQRSAIARPLGRRDRPRRARRGARAADRDRSWWVVAGLAVGGGRAGAGRWVPRRADRAAALRRQRSAEIAARDGARGGRRRGGPGARRRG